MTHHRIPAHLAGKVAPLRNGLFDSLIGTWYQLYYPQVGNGDQSGWKIGRFVPVPLGEYNCNDADVYAHHLRIFKDAGIDFVIIDGTNTLTAAGTLDNTKKLMNFLDPKPADQRVGVVMAFGAHWWADPSKPIAERRALHIAEANRVWNELAQRPSYFTFGGKPLLINHMYGDGIDWNDSRFHVALATGHVSVFKDHPQAKQRGLWGWVADEVLHNDIAIHTVPGWSVSHIPGNTRTPVSRGLHGETLQQQLFEAIQRNPNVITVGCYNDNGEETMFEPARFEPSFPRSGSNGSYSKDYYGEEVPDWYLQIVRAHSLLRWGLEEGAYFRDRDRGDVYQVAGGQLRYTPSLPHKKPRIDLPAGTLRRFLRDQRSEMSIEEQLMLTEIGTHAIWNTNHGSISYGGSAGPTGHARTVTDVQMQNDQFYSKGMFTHPAWQDNGFIEGSFTINVPAGRRAFFSSLVGLAKGAQQSNGVRCEVHCGNQYSFVDVKYTGQLQDIILDVSPNIATQTIKIRVNANGPSSYDWLVWLDPIVTICSP